MIILTKSEVLKDKGFPGSSTGKESSCNTGDPGMLSGLGRSPGEGIGYPLQYSWASLMVQTVKNPPVMRETWIQSLGWEEPPGGGHGNHPSMLAWRISGTESILARYSPLGC